MEQPSSEPEDGEIREDEEYDDDLEDNQGEYLPRPVGRRKVFRNRGRRRDFHQDHSRQPRRSQPETRSRHVTTHPHPRGPTYSRGRQYSNSTRRRATSPDFRSSSGRPPPQRRVSGASDGSRRNSGTPSRGRRRRSSSVSSISSDEQGISPSYRDISRIESRRISKSTKQKNHSHDSHQLHRRHRSRQRRTSMRHSSKHHTSRRHSSKRHTSKRHSSKSLTSRRHSSKSHKSRRHRPQQPISAITIPRQHISRRHHKSKRHSSKRRSTGDTSKAGNKSQDCNGTAGTSAKQRTLKREASTPKPQSSGPPDVDTITEQNSLGMELVSEDDDQESVIYVPVARKSPVIITLDVTDTSEEDEKENNADGGVHAEDKTDSSKSQQNSNNSQQDSQSQTIASNPGIGQRNLIPVTAPEDLSASVNMASSSASTIGIGVMGNENAGLAAPSSTIVGNRKAPIESTYCSTETEIRSENVGTNDLRNVNTASENEPYSPSSPTVVVDTNGGDVEEDSTSPSDKTREEQLEDLAIMELRNELLSDLINKIPAKEDGEEDDEEDDAVQNGEPQSTAKEKTVKKDKPQSTAREKNVQNDEPQSTTRDKAVPNSEPKSTTKEKTVRNDERGRTVVTIRNKTATKPAPAVEAIDSDEERALRDVLLSQMKIKKAKRQENETKNSNVPESSTTSAPTTTKKSHHHHDTRSRSETTKSNNTTSRKEQTKVSSSTSSKTTGNSSSSKEATPSIPSKVVASTSSRRRSTKSPPSQPNVAASSSATHSRLSSSRSTTSRSTVSSSTATRSTPSTSISRASFDSSDRTNTESQISPTTSARLKLSEAARSSSIDRLNARRRRFHDQETSSEEKSPPDKRNRHEAYGSCMDPINPSIIQPEVHRVVRVVDEPLLPEPPVRNTRKKSVKNLPPSDLRRKLNRKAKKKKASPQISPVSNSTSMRDFHSVDAESRHLSTTPEDFTIHRTVNFKDHSCVTTVASSSRRLTEPVTIEIPEPASETLREPSQLPDGPESPPPHSESQQQPPSPIAILHEMQEQSSPVHPLFGSGNLPMPPAPCGATFEQPSPRFGVLPTIGAQNSPTIPSFTQSHFIPNQQQASPGTVPIHSPHLLAPHIQQQVSSDQYYMQLQQQQQHQQLYNHNHSPFIMTTSSVVPQHTYNMTPEYIPDNNGMGPFSPHLQNPAHIGGVPQPPPHYVESRNHLGPVVYPMSQTPIMSVPGYQTPQIGAGGPDVDYRILPTPNMFLNPSPSQNVTNPSCMYGGGSGFPRQPTPMYHHPFPPQSPMVTMPSGGNHTGMITHDHVTVGSHPQSIYAPQYINQPSGHSPNVGYTSALTINTTESNLRSTTPLDAASLHFRPIVDTSINAWNRPMSPQVVDTPMDANCMGCPPSLVNHIREFEEMNSCRRLPFDDPSQQIITVSIAGPSGLNMSASGIGSPMVSSPVQSNPRSDENQSNLINIRTTTTPSADFASKLANTKANMNKPLDSSTSRLQTPLQVSEKANTRAINSRLMQIAGNNESEKPSCSKVKPGSPALAKSTSNSAILPPSKTKPTIQPEVITITDDESENSCSNINKSTEKASVPKVAATKTSVTMSSSSGQQTKAASNQVRPSSTSTATTPSITRAKMQAEIVRKPSNASCSKKDEQINARDSNQSQMSPVPARNLNSPTPNSVGGVGSNAGNMNSLARAKKIVSPASSSDSGISESPSQKNYSGGSATETAGVLPASTSLLTPTSTVSHSPVGSKVQGSGTPTGKPKPIAGGPKKAGETKQLSTGLATVKPVAATLQQKVPRLESSIINVTKNLPKPHPVQRIQRIIIPLRDDDTSTSEDEGGPNTSFSEGSGLGNQFQAKLDEFLRKTRNLVDQKNKEKTMEESEPEVTKAALLTLEISPNVAADASVGEATHTVKTTTEVSTSAADIRQQTQRLNQSTLANKPSAAPINQDPKSVQLVPKLPANKSVLPETQQGTNLAQTGKSVSETIRSHPTPAQIINNVINQTELKLNARNSTATKSVPVATSALITTTKSVATPGPSTSLTSTPKSAAAQKPTVTPKSVATPKAPTTPKSGTTPKSSGVPAAPKSVSTIKLVTAPSASALKAIGTSPKLATGSASSSLTPAQASTSAVNESQKKVIKLKKNPQNTTTATPKPSAPKTPSPSKGTPSNKSTPDTSRTTSADLINELMKKISESRDHLALSNAEKSLLSLRQTCLKTVRDVKSNLEQHIRFTNLSATTQNEIIQLEKKLEVLRCRKAVMDSRASALNSTIIKITKPLLLNRVKSVKLTQAIKRMGQKVHGSNYKVTDMFTNDIQATLQEVDRLHSRQDIHLQSQRGMEFHQLIGKKMWQPKSVIAQSSVSPQIVTSPTPSTSASITINTQKPTPVVSNVGTKTVKELGKQPEPMKKAAKLSLNHKSANEKPIVATDKIEPAVVTVETIERMETAETIGPIKPTVTGKTNEAVEPHPEDIRAEVIGFLTRHATSTYSPLDLPNNGVKKRKRSNSFRINLEEPLSAPPEKDKTPVIVDKEHESPLRSIRRKGSPAVIHDVNLQLCPEWLEGTCKLPECAFQHL